MNLQLYVFKRNFDTQKAERYLKERRIPYQVVDLRKHRLGLRELELFARKGGAKALLNLDDIAVTSHPVAYTNDQQSILEYLAESPQFLRSPIIRDGQRVMVGFDADELGRWVAQG